MSEINNIYDHIIMAQREAQRQNISANMVAINDKLAFSKLRCASGTDVPMICGLKCVYTEDLPEEMTFAVFRAENPPLTLYEENEMLKRETSHQTERKAFSDVCSANININVLILSIFMEVSERL